LPAEEERNTVVEQPEPQRAGGFCLGVCAWSVPAVTQPKGSFRNPATDP